MSALNSRKKECRCPWAESDLLMQAYHDAEWGVPVRDGRQLWEMLVLEGFQAGLSWITILRKREAFRAAFAGFDPAKVAKFTEADVRRLLENPGIIRSRAKIEAAIGSAKIYMAMAEAGEDFAAYCWNFVGGKPIQTKLKDKSEILAKTPLAEKVSAALKKRGFKFVGPVIAYSWMQAVGMTNDHLVGCFRHREVARHIA